MANIMKDKNFGETHRSLLLGIYVLFLFLCATFLKPLFICLFSCMIMLLEYLLSFMQQRFSWGGLWS